MSMLLRTFDKTMGVVVDHNRLAGGTRNRVWFLKNSIEPAAQGDRLHRIPPRRSGNLRCPDPQGHEVSDDHQPAERGDRPHVRHSAPEPLTGPVAMFS